MPRIASTTPLSRTRGLLYKPAPKLLRDRLQALPTRDRHQFLKPDRSASRLHSALVVPFAREARLEKVVAHQREESIRQLSPSHLHLTNYRCMNQFRYEFWSSRFGLVEAINANLRGSSCAGRVAARRSSRKIWSRVAVLRSGAAQMGSPRSRSDTTVRHLPSFQNTSSTPMWRRG